ncbi:MAG: cell division protein FtsX [candidate division WOR-3 bacterium]
MSICLLITAVFLMLTINILKLARSAASHAEVFAFVSDEVAADPVSLLQRVANISGIAAVRFVSKAEALEELRRDLREDTVLVNAIGTEPIPASIRISLYPEYATGKQLNQIEEKLLRLPGVTEVWSGKELLEQLNQAVKTTVLLNILILLIVAGSVIFIAFQTVENSITRRAQEIEIMELVGASRFAVRFPFICQGAFQGLIGSAVAFIMIYVIYRIAVSLIPAPYFPVLIILLFILVLGILLGIGGSIIALNRLPSTLGEKPTPRSLHSL